MKVMQYNGSGGVKYGRFLHKHKRVNPNLCDLEVVRWKSGLLSISLSDRKTSMPFFVIKEKDLIEGIKRLPKQE